MAGISRAHSTSTLLLGSVLAMIVTGQVFAADENSGINDSASLEEIIVTAEKRPERLEDVPASVAVFSGTQLENSGVVGFQDLKYVTPDLTTGMNGVQVEPAIRGITSRAAGPGAEDSIALYVDGFYQPEPQLLNNDMTNVSNVEVLAGPQGTLYGRNATGGAILLTTLDPSFTRPAINLEEEGGSRNDFRSKAYLSTPISDILAIGLGGYYHRNDGYLHDNVTGDDSAPILDESAQLKVKAQPTDNLTLTLGDNWSYSKNATGVAFTATNLTSFGQPGPPPGPLYSNTRDVTSLGPYGVSFSQKANEVNGKADWDTSIGKFTALASNGRIRGDLRQDIDFTNENLEWYASPTARDYTTAAIDYDTKLTSNLSLLAGAEYYKEHAENDDFHFYLFGSLFERLFGTLNTRSFATYVDTTLRLSDNWFLTVGGRESWERKTVFESVIPGGMGPEQVIAPPTSKDFADFTPRANIRYQIDSSSSVYASFSQGFKSGTFNLAGTTLATVTTPVQPEKVTAYEVGYKRAAGPLHLDLAVYLNNYSNLQVNSYVPLGPGGSEVAFLTNAARSRSYGGEAKTTYEIITDLNLGLGAAYTHARYVSFPDALGTVLVNGVNQSGVLESLSGRRLANAPDWKFNASADYTLRFGEHKVQLGVNGSYTSEYAPTDESYEPTTGQNRFYQNGYFLGSASITWTLPGDHFFVGAFVQNFTDERYKLNYSGSLNGTFFVYSEPRAFGGKVGYTF